MADTTQPYNQALQKIIGGVVDLSSLKVMLLSNDATFAATDTTLDAVAGALSTTRANELFGNGWAQGGEAIASVAVTTVETSKARVDAADVSKLASGGPIPAGGSAYKSVIFDDADSDKAPLWFITNDSPRQAGDGTNFLISWNASGIATFNWV